MDPKNEYIFLSKEWMDKIVAAIEDAKVNDPELRKKTSEFTLSVIYIIENLPEALRELYESNNVVIYVELDQGELKRFAVGKEVSGEGTDFIVKSDYEIAKKNFQGELNLVSTFVKRLIKISPWCKISLNPMFSIKSLATMIALLKVMRTIPTLYL